MSAPAAEFGVDRAQGDELARWLGLRVVASRPLRRRAPGRRFPLAPLLDQGQTVSGLARLAGVERATMQRWKTSGGVDEWVADELAVAIGRHPAEVWPEWFDENACAPS